MQIRECSSAPERALFRIPLHTARVCFTNYFRYTTLTSSWRNAQEWGCCEKIVGDGNWGNFTVEKTETWPRDHISRRGGGRCDTVWRVTVWRRAMWDVIRYCSLSHLMLSESRERGWRMQCSIHNPHCPPPPAPASLLLIVTIVTLLGCCHRATNSSPHPPSVSWSNQCWTMFEIGRIVLGKIYILAF